MPSRARALATDFPLPGIGDRAAEDDVGESPLWASQRFERGLAGREFASVVDAALGVVAQLDDGRDVQDVVEPAVAGAGEPVADLFC
jgi:hypothetical protein